MKNAFSPAATPKKKEMPPTKNPLPMTKVRPGSPSHLRALRHCSKVRFYSPTCRKHVFHSKGLGITIRGKAPRAGKLTAGQLRKSKSGKIVSKKKSVQSKQAWHSPNNPLRKTRKKNMSRAAYNSSPKGTPKWLKDARRALHTTQN